MQNIMKTGLTFIRCPATRLQMNNNVPNNVPDVQITNCLPASALNQFFLKGFLGQF